MTKNTTPFTVEPWCLREPALDMSLFGQTESLFALSNGHIGMRGTLDEGEPHELPGTYLNSVYEVHPLPYAEGGYGYPESGQTIVNVTNGKLIRLLVEDEPFDIRYGKLRHHERSLDLRDGLLRRSVEWVSPAGQAVRVQSTRIVSLTQRAVAAIDYVVEAVDTPLRVVIQSELVANEQLPPQADDPRVAAVLECPLKSEDHFATGAAVGLVHITNNSGLRVGAAMDHVVEGPDNAKLSSDSCPDVGRVTITAHLQPGERLRITKFLGYGWSGRRSVPAVRDQVAAAITMAKDGGWDALCAEQKTYLDNFWTRSDVEVDGDAEVQQAIRFALFETLQASARGERRAVPSKGLTGPGYDGHAFWDMDSFLHQVLTFTNPDAAADVLRWRQSILPIARDRAKQLNLDGAAFPWRTINGEECSGYWPAGTAAFHVNADIADAVTRYVGATGDEEFEKTVGLELLVETARLWRSLGQHELSGKFRIDGVTGPDEYSAVADNNVYTNLMAQRNLRAAADCAARHMHLAHAMGVNVEEMASWRDAAEDMIIPFDDELNVHPQSAGFTRHEMWDFDNTPAEKYPLLLHYPYFDLYRKQVVKQADLVLAMQMCPEAFTDEQKLRNFEYYEAITVRDSSLSSCTQAVVAAEVGYPDLAYAYLGESALLDLQDLAANTRDGLHMASLSGSWMVVVMGFGGMRHFEGALWFRPRLPAALSRVAFNVMMHGRWLHVEVSHHEATYTLANDAEPLIIRHNGKELKVSKGATSTGGIPPLNERPLPHQPKGREPMRR